MKGTCYMYQGKLEKAGNSAKSAYDYAVLAEDDTLIFKAELLSVMIKMSGWYNIFFCVQDIPVSDEIIEKLIKHGYSESDVEKIAGLNLWNVLKRAEEAGRENQKRA